MTAFNVAGLLRDAPGAGRRHRLRDRYLALGPDVELAGPVDGELRLQRTNRGILVRGEMDGQMRRTCARCLEPYMEAVRITISEEYLPSVDLEGGTALPPAASDEGAQTINAHHEIDLTGVLRDEFALTEPMHPLCRPDCPGLCAECGARLDERHAAHPVDDVDPRLSVLARLLDREGE